MKTLFTLLLLYPMALFAQTSACGVDFGSSYSSAESIFENKFGDKDRFLSDKTQIVFNDKKYAGISWSRLIFGFQSDGYQQFLNSAVLVVECKTASEAENKRDAI